MTRRRRDTRADSWAAANNGCALDEVAMEAEAELYTEAEEAALDAAEEEGEEGGEA